MSNTARALPPPVGKQQPRGEQTRLILFGTAALVAVVAVVVGVLLATRSTTPSVAPPAQAAALRPRRTEIAASRPRTPSASTRPPSPASG